MGYKEQKKNKIQNKVFSKSKLFIKQQIVFD